MADSKFQNSKLKPQNLETAFERQPFELEVLDTTSDSKWQSKLRLKVWQRVAQDPAGLMGLGMLGIFIGLVLFAPWITSYNPAEVNLEGKLQLPDTAHWLGTDPLGRDIFSRLLYGGRVSLGAAGLVTTLVLVIGALVGAAAGFFGGLLDELVTGVSDVLLALPGLSLALALAGMLGPGLPSIIIALIPLSWVGYARIFRSLVLVVREEEYIMAARAVGLSEWHILLRHVLPNIIGPIIVAVTLDFGNILLAISSLSFLGLGVQPPTPEWGVMLNDGRTYLESAPQLMIYPGLAILLTVMACNLLGDALRDALDPFKKYK